MAEAKVNSDTLDYDGVTLGYVIDQTQNIEKPS